MDRPFEISRLKFEKIPVLAILSSFVIKREKKVLKLILGNLENVIDRINEGERGGTIICSS